MHHSVYQKLLYLITNSLLLDVEEPWENELALSPDTHFSPLEWLLARNTTPQPESPQHISLPPLSMQHVISFLCEMAFHVLSIILTAILRYFLPPTLLV